MYSEERGYYTDQFTKSCDIIRSLDRAFGGRSNWGPEDLAKAVIGHIADKEFPGEQRYAPIELLSAVGELPRNFEKKYCEQFISENKKLPPRRRVTRKP